MPLILGFSAILIKLADVPGIVTVFYRMLVGSIVLAVPFFARRKQFTRISPKGIKLTVVAGLFFGMDLAFFSTAIILGGATIPTLLSNTAPIWVGLGAVLLFKEKMTPGFWIGLLIALVGVVGVVTRFSSISFANRELGAVLGIVSGFFYAGFYLIAQRGRIFMDTLSFFWISTTSSALFLFFASIFMGYPLLGYSKQTFLIFIVFGLVIQVFGWVIISYVQGYIPAYIVSPTLLGQPLLTALWAWLIFHEHLFVSQIFGGVMVLGGILLIHLSRRKV